MKKTLLQQPIKKILLEHGFEHIKNENYAIIAGDNKTKIILKIPNGKNGNGFVLGAQFSDFGQFDGLISHATMRQFDYAYELAYAESYEYTEGQIKEVVYRLLNDYQLYISDGISEIKKHLEAWTFVICRIWKEILYCDISDSPELIHTLWNIKMKLPTACQTEALSILRYRNILNTRIFMMVIKNGMRKFT